MGLNPGSTFTDELICRNYKSFIIIGLFPRAGKKSSKNAKNIFFRVQKGGRGGEIRALPKRVWTRRERIPKCESLDISRILCAEGS